MSSYDDWVALQKKVGDDDRYLVTGRMQRYDFIKDRRIAMARAVIAGKFGNGKFRFDKLRELGYSPLEIHEIQLTVNWMTDLRIG